MKLHFTIFYNINIKANGTKYQSSNGIKINEIIKRYYPGGLPSAGGRPSPKVPNNVKPNENNPGNSQGLLPNHIPDPVQAIQDSTKSGISVDSYSTPSKKKDEPQSYGQQDKSDMHHAEKSLKSAHDHQKVSVPSNPLDNIPPVAQEVKNRLHKIALEPVFTANESQTGLVRGAKANLINDINPMPFSNKKHPLTISDSTEYNSEGLPNTLIDILPDSLNKISIIDMPTLPSAKNLTETLSQPLANVSPLNKELLEKQAYDLTQRYKNREQLTLENKKKLYNEIKDFYKKNIHISIENIPNRDQEETSRFINIILKKYENTVWFNDIHTFISIKTQKICYTPSQILQENTRLVLGKKILMQYGSNLPEVVYIEYLRRIYLTINNDAICSKQSAGFLNDAFEEKKKIIFRYESEGITIHSDVYKKLSQNNYIQSYSTLTENQFLEIKTNIQNKNYFVIIQDLRPECVQKMPEKLLGSGDEVHMIVATTYKNMHETNIVGFGHLTSAHDNGTVMLTPKQYINVNENEQNKVQYYRGYLQGMHVSQKNNYHVCEKTTEFVKSSDYFGYNVHEKIISVFNKNEIKFRALPIRLPYVFDRMLLNKIANDLISEKIDLLQHQMTSVIKEYSSLTNEQRERKLLERMNQAKKEIEIQKEAIYARSLQENSRELIKVKNNIYEEEKQIKKRNDSEKRKQKVDQIVELRQQNAKK